jgi:acyl-coenzyme A thioesterase PaaI-like protein
MIKLKNPYAGIPGYNCFGCSPTNRMGLKMEFYETDEEILSRWEPEPQFQGFLDVLHGGIQATLMDEIASWVVMVKLGRAGVTYRMTTVYRAPVRLSAGMITLRARNVGLRRSIASMEVGLEDGNGRKCSEATVEYFLIGEEQAGKELHYPGKEAFYGE